MASTQIAIFYSKATGRIRWKLKPDSDAELNNVASNSAGEGVLVISQATHDQYPNPADLQTYISSQTGLIPTNDRHVIVDTSIAVGPNVVGASHLDPACGDVTKVGALQYVAHPTAVPGWRYNTGVLTAPIPLVVATPAMISVDGPGPTTMIPNPALKQVLL